VDSDEEPEVEECTEDHKDYHLGFYYPIRIGDVLNKTYRIEHKLGHGDLATVWLARDILGEKDVALKIIKPGNEGENEYNMQNEIISTMQDTSNIRRPFSFLATRVITGSLCFLCGARV
jgi:serine/threonine protein kinase